MGNQSLRISRLVGSSLITLCCFIGLPLQAGPCDNVTDPVDDWQFSPEVYPENGGGVLPPPYPAVLSFSRAASPIGLATGGAKDIGNFRQNIKENYLPQEADVTYEGLFYDYAFDVGSAGSCSDLFCPVYASAQSRHPLTGKPEYYLAIGLESGLTSNQVQRKPLNLVVVLDISGSMSASFDRYYYDPFGVAHELSEAEISDKSKMEVARESIKGMLDHLQQEDRFAIVLFDHNAYLAKPLNYVCRTDMAAIKGHITELTPQGGTHFAAGYRRGTAIYADLTRTELDPTAYENRIIFLTDAMPNTGELSEDALLKQIERNAAGQLFTTFIGIGIDFNNALIEQITKAKGANYYSVYNEESFKERLDEEFEYLVNPLAFGVTLQLDSQDLELAGIYGSPEADAATGRVLYINTLFPSPTQDGAARGGIIMVKVKNPAALQHSDATFSVRYQNRAGETLHSSLKTTLDFTPGGSTNASLRKGVLLTRYASLLKAWIAHERATLKPQPPSSSPGEPGLSKWEQPSVALQVAREYKIKFSHFLRHVSKEQEQIADPALAQEVEILEKLASY